ncbi:MAG: methyltransferase domain-containing protein [Sedimentisphaerales bacterium]
MITNQSLKNHYDAVYKKGQERYFSFSSYNQCKLILDFIDNWEGKSVLEIGCGEGALSAMIGFAGAKKVDAIDYSEEAIKIAKSKINLDNVNYICKEAVDIDSQYDVVIMLGVLEHIDNPFETLKSFMDKNVKNKGVLIISSPSFLNPRGYVWMTLQFLFDVPMSLSDIHFLCPFDFQSFAKKHNYEIEIISTDFDWGGERTIVDFKKRLCNAISDAGMDNEKVPYLLQWLQKAMPYFQHDNYSGANVAYRIERI